MYEIINVEQGTQEWHDLRAKYYKTASRTPSVLNESPFMSREQLAMNLRGEYEPFYSKAMRQGNDLEDMVRERVNELLQDTFMPLVGCKGEYLASLDGINFEKDTLIEIKVSKKTFEAIKEDDIPMNYLLQIQHQMMVFDTVDTGYLAAYNPDTEEIAISRPIVPNMIVIDSIREGWDSFDKEKDTLIVKEFDLSEDKFFKSAAEDYKVAKRISDEKTEILNKAKEKLCQFYKGGKTFGAGVTVSYAKESKTVSYSNIYKDNKELLKDVDLTKYTTLKKASFRITAK